MERAAFFTVCWTPPSRSTTTSREARFTARKAANPPVVLASDVQDFVFDTTDLGKVIKTSITFKPTFRSSGATAQVAATTAFYNTTLLRNNRGVY